MKPWNLQHDCVHTHTEKFIVLCSQIKQVVSTDRLAGNSLTTDWLTGIVIF